jgi:hypothetical protein
MTNETLDLAAALVVVAEEARRLADGREWVPCSGLRRCGSCAECRARRGASDIVDERAESSREADLVSVAALAVLELARRQP